MDCPFCAVNKDVTRILEEREHVFVALSNPRLVPGHTLVIPKRHVEKLSELNDAERRGLFETAITYEERILERFAKGCDIRQHYRPFLPENWIKVHHLHIHLFPREFKDELYKRSMKYEEAMFRPLPEDEREKFTKLLKE